MTEIFTMVERLKSNREIIDMLEGSILKYCFKEALKKDKLTQSVIEKLRKFPTPWYRTPAQLRVSEFLLRGLICRNITEFHTKSNYLKELDKVKFI